MRDCMADSSKNGIDEAIASANQRLKVANLGLSIFRRGGKLSLRGMLPAKGGEGRSQQILSLGIYANPKGVARAEKEAVRIAGLLAFKEFRWEDFGKKAEVEPSGARTCGDWLAALEADYFVRRSRNPKSETTWKHYAGYLNKLPASQPLSEAVLLDLIGRYPAGKRSREYCCVAIGLLVRFAGFDFDPKPYRGSYSPSELTPRELPTDEAIAEWFGRFKSPGWRYVFGLMACYGLRNHEVFNLDLESLKRSPGILTVLDGKTGARRVWPCYPEWWGRWELWRVELLPEVSGETNRDLGSRVTQAFKRQGFCEPYNLRHAWAIRTLEFGWDISLAAAQMGHSIDVHSRTYHRWITDAHHQRAFEVLMARSDRPVAP